jgi:hypothetical protein
LFCADLLATAGHIPVAYVMGMIPGPINHENKILNAAADNKLFVLEHDAHNQIITVEHTEKGLKDVYSCQQILT